MADDRYSNIILYRAKVEAHLHGDKLLKTDHLLVALLLHPGEKVTDILCSLDVTLDKVRRIKGAHEIGKTSRSTDLPISSAVDLVFERAFLEAQKWHHNPVRALHIMSAILLAEGDDPAIQLLRKLDADMDTLRRKVNIALKLLPPDHIQATKPRHNQPAEESVRLNQPPGVDPYIAQWGATNHTRWSDQRHPESAAPGKKVAPTQLSDWLSEEVTQLLKAAHNFAEQYKSPVVQHDDIFRAVASNESSMAHRILARTTDINELKGYLFSPSQKVNSPTIALADDIGTDLREILREAFEFARNDGRQICPVHLLTVLVKRTAYRLPLTDKRIAKSPDAAQLYALMKQLEAEESSPCKESDTANQVSVPAENLPSKPFRLSRRAVRLLRFSIDEARALGHLQVNPMHLLLALLTEAKFSEIDFVRQREYPFEALGEDITNEAMERAKGSTMAGHLKEDPAGSIRVSFGPEIVPILRHAFSETRKLCFPCADLNHIALGVLWHEAEKLEQMLGRHNLKALVLERRLQGCLLYQIKNQDEMYAESTEVDLGNLDALFEEYTEISEEYIKTHEYLIPTERYRRLFTFARSESLDMKHGSMCIEHMLLAIIGLPSGKASAILEEDGLTQDYAREKLQHLYPPRDFTKAKVIQSTVRARAIVEKAKSRARELNHMYLQPEHILLAIAEECHGIASLVCECLNIDGDAIRDELLRSQAEWS